jgi:hypothetical protein
VGYREHGSGYSLSIHGTKYEGLRCIKVVVPFTGVFMHTLLLFFRLRLFEGFRTVI